MDVHVNRLGSINAVFGVVGLALGLLLLALYGSPVDIYYSFDDTVVGFLVASSAMFHLVLAIPCILGGIALKSYSERARMLMIVTSALNLLNPPLGWMLGPYGLWVLLAPETDPLFMNRLHRGQTRAAPAGPGSDPAEEVRRNDAPPVPVVPSPRS